MFIEVHYDGWFETIDNRRGYVNGKVHVIQEFDVDCFSWFVLKYHLKKIGLLSDYKVWQMIPNTTTERDLVEIDTDKKVEHMLKFLEVHNIVALYIEHLPAGTGKEELLPEYCLSKREGATGPQMNVTDSETIDSNEYAGIMAALTREGEFFIGEGTNFQVVTYSMQEQLQCMTDEQLKKAYAEAIELTEMAQKLLKRTDETDEDYIETNKLAGKLLDEANERIIWGDEEEDNGNDSEYEAEIDGDVNDDNFFDEHGETFRNNGQESTVQGTKHAIGVRNQVMENYKRTVMENAMSAIFHKRGNPQSYCDECYYVTTYMRVYGGSIYPIPDSSLWPKQQFQTLFPPYIKKKAGRPPRKRKANEMDRVNNNCISKKGTKGRCSRCGEFGHNVRTCNQEFVPDFVRQPSCGRVGRPSKKNALARNIVAGEGATSLPPNAQRNAEGYAQVIPSSRRKKKDKGGRNVSPSRVDIISKDGAYIGSVIPQTNVNRVERQGITIGREATTPRQGITVDMSIDGATVQGHKRKGEAVISRYMNVHQLKKRMVNNPNAQPTKNAFKETIDSTSSAK